MYFVIMVIAAFLIGTSLYVLKKYPTAKDYLPWVAWGFELIRVTLNHWEFQKRYRDEAVLAARFVVMANSILNNNTDLRTTRKAIGIMLDSAYTIYCPGKVLTETERSVMMSAYVAAISHGEIMETLASVWETHEDLDVRKATLLVVDILGELVNLKDALGQQYFQHLVYGLNKCFKLLRDKGLDKRNLKVVTSTLFRIYKLTKAYRYRRKLSGNTAGELYDEIIRIVEHMAYVVTVK